VLRGRARRRPSRSPRRSRAPRAAGRRRTTRPVTGSASRSCAVARAAPRAARPPPPNPPSVSATGAAAPPIVGGQRLPPDARRVVVSIRLRMGVLIRNVHDREIAGSGWWSAACHPVATRAARRPPRPGRAGGCSGPALVAMGAERWRARPRTAGLRWRCPDGAARGCAPRVDAADAFAVTAARPLDGSPARADAVFHSPPGWVVALMAWRALVGFAGIERGDPPPSPPSTIPTTRCLVGTDAGHLDFRASVLRRRVVLSTVVRLRNRRGRLCYSVVARHRLSCGPCSAGGLAVTATALPRSGIADTTGAMTGARGCFPATSPPAASPV
jgi:hypothetical protein